MEDAKYSLLYDDQHRLKCGFCYDREQRTHGEIKREWFNDWVMMIPVCRKHSVENKEED